MKNDSKKFNSKTSATVARQSSILSPDLIEAFERFIEYHPAYRLSRNLRSLLLEFLMYDGSAEAEYLRDLVIDLDGLFELLDVANDEYNSSKPTNQVT